MMKTQPTPIRTHPSMHRSAARRLDPYTVVDTALTLQEWRRARAATTPVHVVLEHDDKPLV